MDLNTERLILAKKNWDEQLDVLDEDEAKAAEAIRRMRQG